MPMRQNMLAEGPGPVDTKRLAALYRRQPRVFNQDMRAFLDGPLPLPKRPRQPHLPTFSVVMPSFNAGRFIERSIRSILRQDYPNIELIIIDGGSTDGTVEVIKNYQDFVEFWISETDRGQSDALNKGFAKANGDIFCWLNADDLYIEGAFATVAREFSKHRNFQGILFGDWLSIDENDSFIDYNFAFNYLYQHFAYEGFTMNAQACFWHRAVHERFGGFDIELHGTMDYDMLLTFGQLKRQFHFIRINRPFGVFRRHAEQKTQLKNYARAMQEHVRIAERRHIKGKFTWQGRTLRYVFRFRRAIWYLRRGGFRELFRRASPWAIRNLRV